MASLRAINRKASKSEISFKRGDVQALQNGGKYSGVYHPMGCTLNFTPGWEVDIQAARNLPTRGARPFRLLSGLRLARHVPDHLTNSPN
jgi:hypothetical protein